MKLNKEVHLSVFASRQIGSDGYKKLKFTSFYGDDFIASGTDIPDNWNMVIVEMKGKTASLVPRDKVKAYRKFMIDLYGEKYFWGNTEAKVYEINEYGA